MLVLVVVGAWYMRFLQKTKNHPLLLKDKAIHEWYKRTIRKRIGNGSEENEQTNYYTSCPAVEDDEDEYHRRRRRKPKEGDDEEESEDDCTSSDDEGDDKDFQGYYHPYNTPEVQNALTFPVPVPPWFEAAARATFKKVDEQVHEWGREIKETFEMPKQIFKPVQPSTFFQKRKRQQPTTQEHDPHIGTSDHSTGEQKSTKCSGAAHAPSNEPFFRFFSRGMNAVSATITKSRTDAVSFESMSTCNISISTKTETTSATIGVERRWKDWRENAQRRQEELQNNIKSRVTQVRQHLFRSPHSNFQSTYNERKNSSDNVESQRYENHSI